MKIKTKQTENATAWYVYVDECKTAKELYKATVKRALAKYNQVKK